jgi:quinolinate synthase
MKTQPIEYQPEHPASRCPRTRHWPTLSAGRERRAQGRASRRCCNEQNAVLVAHYYVDGDLQALAEETGGCVADSLEMARYGTEHRRRHPGRLRRALHGRDGEDPESGKARADAGPGATCSLDEGCPATLFSAFCDAHPDRTVVVYANTSAEVKARCRLGRHLRHRAAHRAPPARAGREDPLGAGQAPRPLRAAQTGADMLLWDGACVVHEEFKGFALERVRACTRTPPCWCTRSRRTRSSTRPTWSAPPRQLIKAVTEMPNKEFIVATDEGIFWKMHQLAPDKKLIAAPPPAPAPPARAARTAPGWP